MGFLAIAWSFIKSGFGAFEDFCSKPPGSYIVLSAVCMIAVLLYGRHEFNAGVASVKAAETKATVRLIARDTNININIGDIVVKGLEIVHADAERIQREIPQHVTPQIDSDHPVPLGFVRVWNDAAKGPIPGAAAGSDADPSGVPLSTVAYAHAGDTETIGACRVQLGAWWEWYDQHKAAWDKK